MSYDIHLKDPVTGEVAKVPGQLMIGGTYVADYHPETGAFTPALNTEAEFNITYNYSRYYYETYKEKGIRTIYGISGIDSIPMLNDREVDVCDVVLGKIESARKEEIEFEVSEGETNDYWLPTAANALKPLYQLIALAKMRPDCIWDGD